MQNLYQGGACNTSGMQSNQYKRMMNNMAIGSQNAERIKAMTQQGQNF